MIKTRRIPFLLLLAFAAVLPTTADSQAQQERVSRVVDGNTIVLASGAEVSLWGVEVPSSTPASTSAESLDDEAARYLREQLVGESVRIERAGSAAKLYLADGTFFNLKMIRDGYGQVDDQVDAAESSDLQAAQREAQASNLGLWSEQPILSDSEIRQILISRSIAAYSGSCACPYNRDRAGRSCGRRSAYSRPGGASPLCYDRDVTDEMVARYRQGIGGG